MIIKMQISSLKVRKKGIVILLTLIFSSFLFSCTEKKDGTILKIGIAEEPRTLNIWLASDANSRKVLSLMYQNLYVRDPVSLQLIPWLAESMPLFEPETVSYIVKLRPAKWSDGSDLTSDDVLFTINLIKKFKIPRLYSKWKFVKKVEALDSQTIRFYLQKPVAIFVTKSLSVPIVSRSEWADVAKKSLTHEKPLTALLNHKIKFPLGCGPFVLKQRREGAYLYFEKNRFFFGENKKIAGHILGPFVEKIIFKIYSSADVAILALKKGSLDYHWSDIPPGHINGLKESKHIQVFVSKKSALYFMGFNVRHSPFSDAALRKAVSILIDKEFIISRILQGYASDMTSIVPKGNKFWHNPQLPAYGHGLTKQQRIKKAYAILTENGYTWKSPPINEQGETTMPSLIRLPNGDPMQDFTILTPPADYDPHRAASGTIIQEWLKDLGLPAHSRPMSFGALLSQVKQRREFDTFILGYGKLSLDPDYLRSFFHSKKNKKRGWNMSGYHNPDFDVAADASVAAVNKGERQKLIRRMQEMVMADIPYIPLYNPMRIEAINMNNVSGWIKMVGGIGNLWSICMVKPKQI